MQKGRRRPCPPPAAAVAVAARELIIIGDNGLAAFSTPFCMTLRVVLMRIRGGMVSDACFLL